MLPSPGHCPLVPRSRVPGEPTSGEHSMVPTLCGCLHRACPRPLPAYLGPSEVSWQRTPGTSHCPNPQLLAPSPVPSPIGSGLGHPPYPGGGLWPRGLHPVPGPSRGSQLRPLLPRQGAHGGFPTPLVRSTTAEESGAAQNSRPPARLGELSRDGSPESWRQLASNT